MHACAFVYAAFLMREINILYYEHICHKSSMHLTTFSFAFVFPLENVVQTFFLVIEIVGTIQETTAIKS